MMKVEELHFFNSTTANTGMWSEGGGNPPLTDLTIADITLHDVGNATNIQSSVLLYKT